jgi:chromosome partitioning protein
MRTIAIVNQKGGCGKTTTAINLAAVLARKGRRTLLIDMDPQSHCAAGLGVPEERVERGIAEVLLGDLERPVDGADFLWEVSRDLFLAPSTVRLAALEAAAGGLSGLADRDRRLAKLLAHLAIRFEFCVIDCPPTIGFLTFNALRAADEVLVPVETGYFALKGADKQVATIERMVERVGKPLPYRLVPTLFDADRAVDRDVLESLRRRHGDRVAPVAIAYRDSLREAASRGQSVVESAPGSEADADFEALAGWLVERPVPEPFGATGPVRKPPSMRPPDPLPAASPSAVPAAVPLASAAASHVPGGPEASPAPVGAVPPAQVPPPEPDATTSTRAAELARRMRGTAAGPVAGRIGVETKPSPGIDWGTGSIATADRGPEADAGPRLTAAGIRFSIESSAAGEVALVGDFNGWLPGQCPLVRREGGGRFELTLPLGRGLYRYRFVVDGRETLDHDNARRETGPDGRPACVVEVPGP